MTAHRSNNTDHTGGFTLIELIIVVTILAIMSAAVMPVFSGSFSKIQAEHSVRDFVATVRFAQEHAVTAGTEFRLYVDPDLNTYGLGRLVAVDGEDKIFEPVAIQQLETVQLPRRLTLKAVRAKKEKTRGGYYVAFYPSGACDDARINITNEDGKIFYVDTEGGIGRLKVKM